MIIYLCMKYESNTPMYSEAIFHTEIKGHKSDNNWWILSVIELDLYFMIIYLCMKYESNSPMYSKDIAWKPFLVPRSRAITLKNNRWILSVIEFDLYFMIIYLCMKYESNTPMYSKDIARKPFFVRMGQDGRTDVRTRVMLYAPPPHYKWRGHKKAEFLYFH